MTLIILNNQEQEKDLQLLPNGQYAENQDNEFVTVDILSNYQLINDPNNIPESKTVPEAINEKIKSARIEGNDLIFTHGDNTTSDLTLPTTDLTPVWGEINTINEDVQQINEDIDNLTTADVSPTNDRLYVPTLENVSTKFLNSKGEWANPDDIITNYNDMLILSNSRLALDVLNSDGTVKVSKNTSIAYFAMASIGEITLCCNVTTGLFLYNSKLDTTSTITLASNVRFVGVLNGSFLIAPNGYRTLYVVSTSGVVTTYSNFFPTNLASAGITWSNDALYIGFRSSTKIYKITYTNTYVLSEITLPTTLDADSIFYENGTITFAGRNTNTLYIYNIVLNTFETKTLSSNNAWVNSARIGNTIVVSNNSVTTTNAIFTLDGGTSWSTITFPTSSPCRFIKIFKGVFYITREDATYSLNTSTGLVTSFAGSAYHATEVNYEVVSSPTSPTQPTIDTELIETSTNSLENKEIYEITRGYTSGNIFGLEYLAPFQNKYIITSKLVASPKIIFTGDSTNFTGSLQSDNTKATANAPSQLFTTKITRSGIPATVIQSGVSGQTASYWRTNVLPGEIAQNPDCFILKWGINDQSLGIASLTSTMNTALASIRAALPKAGIVLCVPNNINGPYNMTEAWVKQVSDLYRSIARTYQCVFYDEYRMFMDINVDYTVGGFVDEYMDTFDVSQYGMTNHFAHIHPKMIFNSWQADTFFNMLYPEWVREYAIGRTINSITYTDANISLTNSYYHIRNNICYVQIKGEVLLDNTVLTNTNIILPKPFANVETNNIKIDINGALFVRGLTSDYNEIISYPINL